MVSVVKSEWHQVEKRYGIEIDADILSEIYPDLDENEIQAILDRLDSGEEDITEIINDAWNNDVELDWDYLNNDDWWTDRKGGYEITYSAEEWEVREEYVSPITHKCTKCKWEGSKFEADWQYPEDGAVDTEPKKVCPMCESDTELTEVGIKDEQEIKDRMAKWDAEDSEEEPIEESELEAALEELKLEFEQLMAHTHKCTECEWTGTEEQCETEGICPNCCAYTEKMNDE